MTIYWPKADAEHPDEQERKPATLVEDDSGLAFDVPVEVLRRHGARVLEPSTASNSAAGPALRPTAYVSSVLLIPREELLPTANRNTLNDVLGTVGMRLPFFEDDEENSSEPPEAELPPAGIDTVPVALRSLEPSVDVDAWTALQAFRGRAATDRRLAREDPALEPAASESDRLAKRISLDHLMFASSWNGNLGGVPGPIQGFVPPFGSDVVASGYLVGPVAVELPAIARKGNLTLGRPAVVAVLDTGIGQNTWLGIDALSTSELDLSKWPTGNYVQVDTKIQKAVEDAGRYLRQQKLPVEVITHPKDEPLSRNPLVGTQAWCFGHGEFCAGIIAQIAPEATVLAVRVMGTDGVARESAVVAALQALVRRIDGTEGDAPQMVDIVSLSMGFPFERTEDEQLASPLAVEIENLRRRGVLVVAAAGNSASSQPFFPACLSTVKDGLTTPPVVSVGALNPNGSKALFTNEGPFVTCYATGTNVISTFPQDANASRQPAVQVSAKNRDDLPQYRQSPDVDDHRNSPFGVWTGSSFAAPHVAAHLANALHGMAPVTGTSTTSKVDQAMKHAKDAVAKVQDAAQPQAKPSAPAP
jgi:subtilisin family serine protease